MFRGGSDFDLGTTVLRSIGAGITVGLANPGVFGRILEISAAKKGGRITGEVLNLANKSKTMQHVVAVLISGATASFPAALE